MKKIVLAEDNKFISLAYTAGLKEAGFKVYPARDGEEAIEMISTKNPDLVLLDLIMPFKTGFEVLEEIKKNKEMTHIPILIFSNLSQQNDIDKARDLGAMDFINKDTITMSELVEKINNILP